jgi:hypothetical protein
MAKKGATTIEGMAAELGKLLGTTEVRARGWIQQRGALLKTLHSVRDRASSLIDDLSGRTNKEMRKRASSKIATVHIPEGNPAELMAGRKKRRLTGATRVKLKATSKRR